MAPRERSSQLDDTLPDAKELREAGGVRLIIEGDCYDIPPAFASKHPGGDVIYKYHERDASDVFHGFHSTAVLQKLRRFPHVPAVSLKVPQETKQFRALRSWAQNQGLFEASSTFYILTGLHILAMVVAAAWVAVSNPGQIWALVSAGLVLGLAMSQGGWYSHDVLHHQVFHSRSLNNILGCIVGNLLQGFSVQWWKNKHNTHHATSNVHGADPDIDTMPLLAWDEKDEPAVKGQGWISRLWLRNQHLMCFPVMAVAQVSWRIQSLLEQPYVRSHKAWENSCIALHYVLYATLVYFSSVHWYHAVILCACIEVFGGWGKAVPFVLNHSGRPVVEGGHSLSHLRLQVLTSRNVPGGWFIDWFMGGLNYQIEHHLFPDMPRHNLRQVIPKVKEMCAEHGIDYCETGFWKGYEEVFSTLKRVGNFLADCD